MLQGKIGTYDGIDFYISLDAMLSDWKEVSEHNNLNNGIYNTNNKIEK